MTLDEDRCEYEDYRGEVCGATRDQHEMSTHLFTSRGKADWLGFTPSRPLLVIGSWVVIDAEGRPLTSYGPDESGRRAALRGAIDVPGATVRLVGPARAELIVPKEESCGYIYAEGAPCPFPKEKHTGCLADFWVENPPVVSEPSPTHPFHPKKEGP